MYFGRKLVHQVHSLDLSCFFVVVALVDADCINPEVPCGCSFAQAPQHIVNIECNEKLLLVAEKDK